MNSNSIRANSSTDLTPIQQLSMQPCSSQCRICQSENMLEINRLRSTGMILKDISEFVKNKYDQDFSLHALSRHFKKRGKLLLAVSADKILQDFDEQTQTLALHQKQTLFVMDKTFKKILEHIEAGTLLPSVTEWLALQKHFYQILQDPNHGVDDGMVAIFQRAAEKHGFSLDQAVLVKPAKRAD